MGPPPALAGLGRVKLSSKVPPIPASAGVEAAVGPHRELPFGPGVAHQSHSFTLEEGGAPSGVGAALPEPDHQHVAGGGGDGQQRVIAPD